MGTLAAATALAAAIVGGSFYAFSSFVMGSLVRLPPVHGIGAMQAINQRAVTSGFMIPFMGAAILCLAVLVLAIRSWGSPESAWLLAGALFYLVGSFAVTAAFNVPRNDALAALDAAKPESAEVWRTYVSQWTAWNHVRTVASLLSSCALAVAWKLG